MKQTSTQTPQELLVAIILAAVLISGSLIFLGVQMRPEPQSSPDIDIQALAQQIKQEMLKDSSNSPGGIDQQALAQQIKEEMLKDFPGSSGIDQQALAQQIKEEMLNELSNGEFLAQEIEKGIQNYIKKQQEAQQKAREEQERQVAEKAKDVPRVSAETDHIYGNPEAEITLIEYSDFECPYCKRFHNTPKELVEAYDGKVNWVYRHYPLQFHNPGAQKQSEASECAAELGGNDAFWKYADAIYERTTSNGKGFPIENLVPLAVEFGLDTAAFQECLDSDKYAEKVQKNLQDGTNSGVTGTPGSILLNNKTGAVSLQVGAVPLNQLKAAVDELLQE